MKLKITFIATGETIDKNYSKNKGTYNFDISDPSIHNILKNIIPNFEYDIISSMKKDSLDMTDDDRFSILETCKNINNDKIIITHGTDTLLNIAERLSEINDKVIILVGASQPAIFKETDADFNVGAAVGAVNILSLGVYIAMNGRIYEWDKCEKLDSGHFIEKKLEIR